MTTRSFPSRLTVIAIALSATGASALAQDRPDRRDDRDQRPQHHQVEPRRQPAERAPQLRFDDRYHHDHYYPPRGYAVTAVPRGSLGVRFGASRFWFDSGVWYQPVGGRFVVTLPPIGIVLPILPNAFVTLSVGGAPYFYANGVYYASAPGRGFVVVAPPPGAELAAPAPVAAPAAETVPLPEPIVYPRQGQSPAQTETDSRACNRWATTQRNAMADAQVFQRAVAACMDGRGYTLR